MKTLTRWYVAVSLWMAWIVVTAAQQASQQQGEFVPIDQLPPQDQLPAAPLLIGAYAFVLVVLFAYVFMVSRRLRSVQQEIDRLDTAARK